MYNKDKGITKMNVSSIKFREGTLSQTGTIGKILMWMQDNEKFCRDTNIKTLTGMISNSTGLLPRNVTTTLHRMINNQLIHRRNGVRRATFVINYYHEDIPGYILDRAPEIVRDRVKAMKKAIEKDGAHKSIDKNGCIVTKPEEKGPEEKPEKEPEQEPKEEPGQEPKEEPVAEPIEKLAGPKEGNQTARPVVVPVEVSHNDNGMNISITLNLNLR